jgi:N-acetylmuramoyl-L-alanine amidase
VIHHHETTASGTEVQILGLHRAGQKASAMTSNTDNVEEEVGMLDVNDPQTAIIIAQYLQAFQGNSVLLGTYIQQEFSSQGRTDRGVKQMGLEVLAGSAMPGVLVECGFINNPSEEEYMNSEVGLDEIARAIFNGVRAYKAEIEKN